MKKCIAILLFSLSVCQLAYTQTNKFDKVWIVGIAGIELKFNLPNIDTTGYTTQNYCYHAGGHSNICDTNGNSVFSTDGFFIYDSSYSIMNNGDTIVGKKYIEGETANLFFQTSIILPFPNKKYYVITPSASDAEYLNNWGGQDSLRLYDQLLYHIVDMNANGGMGSVVKKGITLLENVELNRMNMMACRHGNGKDWWLLKQAKDTNLIYKFLVTSDSIYNYGIQGFAEPHFRRYDQGGQAMFSLDGSKYASCVRGAGGHDANGASFGKFFICDFDRCTGLLSNPKEYRTKSSPCTNLDPNCFDNYHEGLCFSPNGRFLYVSSTYSIKQLDLWDADTATQWSYVFGLKTNGYFGNLYNAPDGKIYVGNSGAGYKSMTVIDSPDIKGIGCQVCYDCMQFPDYGVSGPPCMPNYHLGAKVPCWPLGNSEIVKESNELEVYPNPSSTVFYIKNKNGKKKELYSAIGQLLSTTSKNEIEVSRYAKGVYYIKCEGQSKKVIIE